MSQNIKNILSKLTENKKNYMKTHNNYGIFLKSLLKMVLGNDNSDDTMGKLCQDHFYSIQTVSEYRKYFIKQTKD